MEFQSMLGVCISLQPFKNIGKDKAAGSHVQKDVRELTAVGAFVTRDGSIYLMLASAPNSRLPCCCWIFPRGSM